MSKRNVEVVVGLLDTYEDVLCASRAENSGQGGDNESKVLVLDTLYHQGTYRELEILLGVMRNLGGRNVESYEGRPLGSLYQHLRWWWLDAPKVRREVPRRTAKGKVLRDQDGRMVTVPTMVRLRHRYADEEQAWLGASWIAGRWGPWAEAAARDRRPFRPFPAMPKDMLLESDAA